MDAAQSGSAILNIGCGQLTRADAVNVDRVGPPWHPGVDVVADLDHVPWPFPDGAAREVYALDVLEHLADFCGAMAELHRLLIPGGRLHVRTSRWDSKQSYTDPTHRRFLTEDSFTFWDPETWQARKYPGYAQGRFFRRLSVDRNGEELAFELERI